MHDPTAEPVQFGVIISRYRAELERLNYVRETINVCLLSIRSLFLALRTQVGHASPSVRGAINRCRARWPRVAAAIGAVRRAALRPRRSTPAMARDGGRSGRRLGSDRGGIEIRPVPWVRYPARL